MTRQLSHLPNEAEIAAKRLEVQNAQDRVNWRERRGNPPGSTTEHEILARLKRELKELETEADNG